MRIGREIGGKESLNVPRVQGQGAPEVLKELPGKNRTIVEQMPNPQPREASERHFQAACPINSHRIGILVLPVIPLPKYSFGIPLFPRQTITLRKRNEVLWPICLQNHLGSATLL